MEPLEYYYDSINRNAILVKPKEPFFNWQNQVFPDDEPIHEVDVNGKSLRLFDTFAKPHDLSRPSGKPFQNPNFENDPNFAKFYFFWQYFVFQIKPNFIIFGKNWIPNV